MDAETIIRILEQPTTDRRPAIDDLDARAHTNDLIQALRISREPLTRNILCYMLGSRHAETAVAELLLALHDASAAVRAAAADALAKIGNRVAGKPIMEQLTIETDEGVRQELVLALGASGYGSAIPFLVDLLGEKDEVTRGCAAWSLGALRAKTAEEALKTALKSESGTYAKQRMVDALKLL